jgi:hypothetical protein
MKPYFYYFPISFLICSHGAIAQLTPNIWGPRTNQVQMSIKLDYEAMASMENAFSSERLTSVSGVLVRLGQHSDALSSFLWQSLSNDEQLVIRNYEPLAPASKQAEDVSIKAINRIIKGPCIYTPERFAGVQLSDETKMGHFVWIQGREAPSGEYWSHLNYLLLRDAYATELSGTFKADENKVRLGEPVILTIDFTNTSTNEKYWIVNAHPLEDDKFYVFDVTTPSGKHISPKGDYMLTGSRIGYFLDSSNRGRFFMYVLSNICKFDEIGTYTIKVTRKVDWEGHPSFTVVSNPLSIQMLPEK